MSQWNETRVTRKLGISHPILLGPFGRGGSTALLAATVSNLGGLGSFGANELGQVENHRSWRCFTRR